MVGSRGLEPLTFATSMRRSSQTELRAHPPYSTLKKRSNQESRWHKKSKVVE